MVGDYFSKNYVQDSLSKNTHIKPYTVEEWYILYKKLF